MHHIRYDLIGRESAGAFKKLGLNVPRLGVDKKTVKWLQEDEHPKLKLTDGARTLYTTE